MTQTSPAAALPESRWSVHPAVVSKELDGELVLLSLESGVYFGLDPVGTRVWALLRECADVRSICTRMIEEFDVSADVVDADVRRLIAELHAQNLIVPAEAPAVS